MNNIDFNKLHTTKSMEIPRNIHQSICKQAGNDELSNDYNIIYKCCGNLNGFQDYCQINFLFGKERI